MLDTLLAVEGETSQHFRWTIAIDHDYPEEATRDAVSPPLVIATKSGPPRSGATGWFYHLDVRNVQLLQVSGPQAIAETPDRQRVE